jgi:membrane protein DedA with SNARE-associated domain
MYLWGTDSPAEAWVLLDRVPGIGFAMQAQVRESLAEEGLSALFLGPLTGTPYKLYAVAAGQQDFAFAAFLLVSVPARATRFVLVCLLAYTVSRLLSARLSTHARYGLLAAVWLIFYAGYFTHMGW